MSDKPTSLQSPMEIVDKAALAEFQPPPLANRKEPFYAVKQERPAHRLAIELAAKGLKVKEIAQRLGYTEVAINNWLRQPHSQENLVKTIHHNANTVDAEVAEVIKKNVINAAKFYEMVLNDPSASRMERKAAADEFMNRRYGKATQPMANGKVVDLNALSDDELAAMITPVTSTTTS